MKPAVCLKLPVSLSLVLTLLCGCDRKPPPSPPIDGKALANMICATCHTPPIPGNMAADEWPYLLAWMGNYLGHTNEIPINPLLVSKNFVPPQKVVSREQFDAIQNYVVTQALADYHLPQPLPKPAVTTLFEAVPVKIESPVASMVAIDPVDRALLIGSLEPPTLTIIQNDRSQSIVVDTEPVDFERLGPVRRISLIGDFSRDARKGQIADFDASNGTRQVLIDHFPRIAAHRSADFDGDGTNDLVVCGFGDYPSGRVSVWWGGAKLEEQILLDEPGAVSCDVADFNGDGRPDIVVAIGSNRPRIMAFVNEGGRKFTPRTIFDRPVGWGYNRCRAVDWDRDGKPDIVEVAGNNIELRGRPLKSWHGVRVLRNEGDWKFREILFEPLPGATDLAIGDFNGDGRADLAVTAFCPDWRQPFPTTFLLLLQRPDGTVERSTLDDSLWNHWLRVSAGDADGDGRTDLILGAAHALTGVPAEKVARYNELVNGKPTVLLLRNRKGK